MLSAQGSLIAESVPDISKTRDWSNTIRLNSQAVRVSYFKHSDVSVLLLERVQTDVTCMHMEL